jgi:hypothetical protein
MLRIKNARCQSGECEGRRVKVKAVFMVNATSLFRFSGFCISRGYVKLAGPKTAKRSISMAENPLRTDESHPDREQRQQISEEWRPGQKHLTAEVRLPAPEPSDAPWYPRFVNRINGQKPSDP